jgi:two-component system nitrate/nitrite response regulator NarL
MDNDQASGGTSVRLLVAERSRIYTNLLSDALRCDPGFEVVPFDSDSNDLIATATGNNIDVLVLSSDLDEQEGRGFEVLRDLRAVKPEIRVVVLLDSCKDEAVVNAFRAGARGVFSRKQAANILGQCIRCVHQGQIWANSRELTAAIAALAAAPVVRAINADGMNLLSRREAQVVRCLAEGLTNREIAERMKLSQHTIKNHLFRVFDKLGVSNRVELLFMTMRERTVESASEPDHSQEEFSVLQKAAEAGLPGAEFTLSRMFFSRKRDSRDLVSAYKWHLIATSRAAEAGEAIEKTLSTEQRREAENEAKDWLSSQNSSESVNVRLSTKTVDSERRIVRTPPEKRSLKAKQACP